MCEIESERNGIDALLDQEVSPSWFEDPCNRRALLDVARRRLSDEYCDLCLDACIEERREACVARRLRQCAAKPW